MITFFSAIILLLLGYFLYSKIIEKLVNINSKAKTPAFASQDGIDFVPMSQPRNSLINLLNIAGTGPIFGPILAALYGPVALLWIVFGCIFAGAVHDFLLGIISLRNNGATLPMLAEKYISKIAKHAVNVFSLLLLILVATVFVVGPANLILELFKSTSSLDSFISILSKINLVYIIGGLFIYNFLATLLPIDKVIGRIYPYFGALLIFSAVAMFVSVVFLFPELTKPELNFANMHPANLPIYPLLFLVLSCGAISGFHATQIPIVARTIENESHARNVFYGMMIAEGIVALIWAYATIVLLDGETLLSLIKEGTPSLVVSKVAVMTLGSILGTFAIMGVIVLPLSSGSTAFRAIRLMIAEYLGLDQKSKFKRLIITIPAFLISMILCTMDFQLLWQYFSWANQTLASIALWICTIYLISIKKPMYYTFFPALFMTTVVLTFIMYDKKMGLGIDITVATIISVVISMCLGAFVFFNKKNIELKFNGRV